ncbi:MAG: HAMP domain-containing histidine kinase [Deltaproteobacteria bacterium]|nr:HAMP domain-containing histidine kinase [Deltaproteobacteria bacterium]
MKKLRLQFFAFFLLLQLGLLFLLLNSYRQMGIEEKSLWESESTKVYNQMQAQMSDLLNLEDARSFKEYRFFGASALSNLGYPKGWVGYFQVDPDGSFSTPYLPASEEAKALPDYSLRLNKQKEIEKSTSDFRKGMKGAFADRSVKGEGKPKARVLPNIYPNPIRRKQLESAAPAPSAIQGAMKDNDKKLDFAPAELESQVARRQEAVPAGSVKTFEQNFVESKKPMPLKSLPLEKPKPQVFLGDVGGKVAATGQGLAEATPLREKAPSSVVWLDPFQAKVSGASLIFFRRVWVEEKMYLQGFVLQAQPFFEALMQGSFDNSDLPRFSGARWMYEKQPLAQYGRVEAAANPQNILYSHPMDYPLASIRWEILGRSWPQISTRLYLNLFSGGLFLFATLGLFWIYRSSSEHIRLSQKRQDFVAAVSHELKTPLTSIRMYSEMLEDGWVKDESKQQEYYRNIHQESERLSRLIENVLQMARLEKQTCPLNLIRQSPLQDLQAWERQFAELAAREGFVFRLNIEGELPAIQYEPEALKEVLLILLENSIKFSRASAGKNLSLQVKGGPSFLQLIWRDQGPGVPARELKQIFEKFYRVENELTRKTKGTGIGLAIAQATVQAMGAKIEARNAEGGGLEIEIRWGG